MYQTTLASTTVMDQFEKRKIPKLWPWKCGQGHWRLLTFGRITPFRRTGMQLRVKIEKIIVHGFQDRTRDFSSKSARFAYRQRPVRFCVFFCLPAKIVHIGHTLTKIKNVKNVFRFWHVPQKGAVAKIVLRGLDILFEDQQFFFCNSEAVRAGAKYVVNISRFWHCHYMV